MTDSITGSALDAVRRGPKSPGPLYWVLRAVMRAVVGIVLFRHLHISGQKNVLRHGGLLVISNHIATADPPILGATFPRPVHFMAKVEWFANPLVGFLARQFLCFPVVRHTADRGALRYTLELLRRGQVVCLYPEGTRALDARIHPPEAGAGFLARRGGVPILPVAIWGSENVWPKGARIFRPAHTYMTYGEPFWLPSGELDNQEAAEYMMSKVADLLPEAYRGFYQSWRPGHRRERGSRQGSRRAPQPEGT